MVILLVPGKDTTCLVLHYHLLQQEVGFSDGKIIQIILKMQRQYLDFIHSNNMFLFNLMFFVHTFNLAYSIQLWILM